MDEHLGDKLIDYAWGTLIPEEQAQADAHLGECGMCRAELAEHQKLVGRVAEAVPAMLPQVPARVRAGWPAVAARVPRLRRAGLSAHRSAPGFIVVGLAISTAALLIVAVMAQAWLGLGRPPLTATAFAASATPSASVTLMTNATPAAYVTRVANATHVATATHTPERPLSLGTPMGWLPASPALAPRPLPVVATAKP